MANSSATLEEAATTVYAKWLKSAQDNQQLSAQLQATKTELETTNKQLAQMNVFLADNEVLKRELQRNHNDIHQKYHDQLDELKGINDELNAKMHSHTLEIAQCKKRISDLNDLYEKTKKKHTIETDEFAKQRLQHFSDIKKHEENIQLFNDQIKSLSDQNHQHATKIKSTTLDLENVNTKLAKMNTLLTTNQIKKLDLERNHNVLQTNSHHQSSQIENMQKLIRQLQQENQTLKDDNKRQKQQLDEQPSKLVKVNSNLEKIEYARRNFEKDHAEQQARIQEIIKYILDNIGEVIGETVQCKLCLKIPHAAKTYPTDAVVIHLFATHYGKCPICATQIVTLSKHLHNTACNPAIIVVTRAIFNKH